MWKPILKKQKMKPLQLLSYLVPLIIGALIAWAIIPKDNGEKKLLHEEKKHLLYQRDSILRVQNVLIGRDSLWTRIHAQDRDSLLIARKQSNVWRNEYKKIRSAPVILYSEQQLDSATDALIEARHR